ncbi:MAG: phosphate signaling complex protein PhoU [Nitrospinae bacterium]|nr:phosphate signaling complex protein PhoU [Nitrospinota bacterium]
MPKHMLKEIERVKSMVRALSTQVEESVHRAVNSIERRDAALANRVIESDIEIDHMEVDVEEECLKILALHQPVAQDLRFLVAALKINSDLERIADLAVNIAERAIFLSTQEKLDIPFDFSGMADKAKEMLEKSLEAFFELDSGLAREVCAADDEVDAINREVYDKVKDGVIKHPASVNSLLHFLSVSRHLERIADHATNIAEDVIYMKDGDIVRHKAEEYKEDGSGKK